MNPESAKTIFEQEILPTTTAPLPVVARGIVGWKDADEHADLGKSTTNDGHTLVRVTLHRGAPPVKKTDEKAANGIQILCKVGGPFYWIPAKGTPVIVLFPDGDTTSPGSGVIACSDGPSPDIQFSKTGAKLDLGPNQTFHIKAKRITLSDYSNRYITLGDEPGIKFSSPDGTGGCIQNGNIQWYAQSGGNVVSILELTSGYINILHNTSTSIGIHMNGTTITTIATTLWECGGMVLLGKGPHLVTNTALWGPTGVAGVASPSVFISPT